MGTVEKLAEIAKSRGNPALCVTNHGTIGQYARQYFSCRDEGIKPIFGCEVYVNNFRDEVKEIIEKIKILKEENKKIKNDKDPVSIKNLKKIVKLDSRLEKIKPNNHLILLAKNKTGLDNLIKITNDGWKNGFYSRPRVTMDFVMENKEGLIISTACIAGEIPQTLIKEGYEEAKELLLEWKKVFGKSNLFVEITMIDFKQQVKITKELIRLAKECKLKWIVTTDSHYIEPEDSETHDILLMINSGKTVNDLQKNPEEVWQFESKDLWYKDYKGMYRTWKKHYRKVMSKEDFHSAIDSVMDIIERIEEFDLDTSVKLPMIYETPEEGFRELKRLCKKGWKRREIENENNISDYIERRDFELSVIEQMEYSDFFLIMEDMLSWARRQSIPVGPSRGCFVPGSKVLMYNGTVKNIEDIKVGDMVISKDGNPHRVYGTPRYKINEIMYSIKGGSNDEIVATHDHKILVLRTGYCKAPGAKTTYCKFSCKRYYDCPYKTEQKLRWTKAENIKVGDFLCYPKINLEDKEFEIVDLTKLDRTLKYDEDYVWYEIGTNSLPTKKINRYIIFNEDFARFAGYFIGNGYSTISKGENSFHIGISLSINKKHLLSDVILLIKKIFGFSVRVEVNNNLTCMNICWDSKVCTYFLKKYFGSGAHNKVIPDELITSNENIIKNLLFGLMNTDGHLISKAMKICYGTSSEKLIRQVQLLYSQLGFYSNVGRYARKNDWVDELKVSISGKQLIRLRDEVFPEINILDQAYYKNDFLEDDKYFYFRVNEVKTQRYGGKVYDLSVEDDPSYIINGSVVHNSAAGSLVSYLLGITDIDPLKHNLLFERFINIDRKDVPDIDVDFSPERRGEVRNYLREKYGHEYTMFIGSYGTFGTKAVIQDVARVLCIPLGEVFRVTTKMVGGVDEDHTSWEDLRKFYPDLDNFFDKYPEAFNLCERLRGQIKNLSKHAAGVVICSQNVYNSMPIHTIDGVEVTALQIGLNRKYKELEALGFPKFDLLGLNNLDVIYDCVRLIEENHGKKIDLLKIPLNDKKALRLGNKKDTLGVFQLETHLMRQIIDTVGINTFNDISAIVAIARPGPLNAKVHEFYADRKSGEETFKIPECWENDLRSSFGLIIYQEQVMNMVQRIGFSQAESNKFRKFVSKKPLPDEPLYKDFLAYKKRFIKGAVRSGIPKIEAKKYWQDIEFFSKYSFNLSHSVAYALIAYWELYLKALYPVEFHCALLMNTKRGVTGKGKKERNKFEEYISSTRDRDIKVLPIDINKTSANFNIEKGNIRAGYTFIKDIGDKAPEELETNYPFKSINKFFKSKINWSVLNKSKMTALIKVGAFDSIYKNRRKLLAIYETWQETKKTKTKSKEFIERYDKKTLIESIIYHYDNKVKLNDFTALEKLMMEKEYLGFYFSGHPIDKYKKVIEKHGMRYCREFRKKPKSNDKVVGMISSIRVITTKYGENMAFMDIEDGIDKVNIALWPEYYGQYKKILKEGNLIVIKLKKSNRPDSFEIAGQDGRKQIMLLSEFN